MQLSNLFAIMMSSMLLYYSPLLFEVELRHPVLDGRMALMIIFIINVMLLMKYPLEHYLSLFKQYRSLFKKEEANLSLIKRLVNYARCYKRGMIPFEDELQTEPNAFMKENVMLLLDVREPQSIFRQLDYQMHQSTQYHQSHIDFHEKGATYCVSLSLLLMVVGVSQLLIYREDPQALMRIIQVMIAVSIQCMGLALLFYKPMAHHLRRMQSVEQTRQKLVKEAMALMKEQVPIALMEEQLVRLFHQPQVKKEMYEKEVGDIYEA